MHGRVAETETVPRVDGAPKWAELDARRVPLPVQHHVAGQHVGELRGGGRRGGGGGVEQRRRRRRAAAAGGVLLRRQR